ncbi:hypothetical protein [Streptomyces sp. NPDC051662]|uniref:hypothetical protein n=1 Tax=Streptomyces sp. NPDC051662 TaxID=3154750 RepID=UPI0034227EDC
MKRARDRVYKAAGWAASAAGTAVRLSVQIVPGTAGAGLVSYGLWLAWELLGFICAGAFLLLLDWRVP